MRRLELFISDLKLRQRERGLRVDEEGGRREGGAVGVYIYPIVWSWSDCFPPPQV